MKTVAEIKQAILALPKAEYAELVEWLYEKCECEWEEWDRQLEADVAAGKLDFFKEQVLESKETLQQLTEGSAITPLEEWRLFPLRVEKRWGRELYNLQGFIHYSSSVGRLYARLALDSLGEAPKVRSTSPEERARQLIVALLDLHTKDCSIAGAILSDLRTGYPNAGSILCRVMLESHILGQFLVKYNEEDAAERYNGSVSFQLTQDHFPPDARELHEEYISIFPDAKDRDYGWASGVGSSKRWTLRDMAEAVNAKDLYTAMFKVQSEYAHPDPAAYFGDVDEGLIPPAWEALSELNSSRLYGQTDGPFVVRTAYEVAQYITSSTLTLMNAWPILEQETLEEEFRHRSETVLDLLKDASLKSPFLRRVLGIQDEP